MGGVSANDATQLRHRIAAAACRRLHADQERRHRALADAEKQLLLVPDMVVDAGLGQPGGSGQLAEAGRRIAVRRKQLGGCPQDVLPASLARHPDLTRQ